MKRLVCIGDSHASFFSGMDIVQPEYPSQSKNRIPFLEGNRLGAVLAYNLIKEGTSSQGREKLFEIISKLDNKKDSVLFCFGEIDCRAHLLKHAQNSNLSIEEVVEDCVNRYFKVIDDIKNSGFEVFVWNVIPTSNIGNNPEYPHFGTHLQRNAVTMKFNKFLKYKCQQNSIAFIDIFRKLVYNNTKTKEFFLFDGIHLGQLAMPYFLEEIKRYFPYIKDESFDKLGWRIRKIKCWSFEQLRKFKLWLKWA